MGYPRTPLTAADLDRLDWGKAPDGLLPAVVQDARTLQVLMQAWMNRAALAETLESGEATFFSRSRQSRWRKGETSGARQRVTEVLGDCDGDSLLVKVEPAGPACHEGLTSCFGEVTAPGLGWIAALEATIAAREGRDTGGSYTAKILSEGPLRAAQKVGEEGVETALAGAAGTGEQVLEEAADLMFHLLILLRTRGLSFSGVLDVLRRRGGSSRVA